MPILQYSDLVDLHSALAKTERAANSAGDTSSWDGGEVGQQQADPLQQNTARAGNAMGDGYQKDPIAERRRERERADDATRVASCGGTGKPESKPSPEKGEKPTKPEPAKPQPPSDDDRRCSQMGQLIQRMSNDYSTAAGRYQAAVQADNKATAQRAGCELLDASARLMDEIGKLSAAKCKITGDVHELEGNIRQMRAALQQEIKENCGGSGNPVSSVTKFDGRWAGDRICKKSGDADYRWVISFSQTGNKVSGFIHFHKCPGGGGASYSVSGQAGANKWVELEGKLTSSRGPLGSDVSKNPTKRTFTITKGQPPSPNYAP